MKGNKEYKGDIRWCRGWSKVERILSPVRGADQATKTSLCVLVGGKFSKYLQSCRYSAPPHLGTADSDPLFMLLH